MLIAEMHYNVDVELNRLASQFSQDLTLAEKDKFINDAQSRLITLYQHREDRHKLQDILAPLLVSATMSGTKVSARGEVYEFPLSQLTLPYRYFKRAVAHTNCGITPIDIVGHGELTSRLNDALQKPSKRWKRLIGTFESNSTNDGISFYVYSDEDFTPAEIRFEYYREPKPVFFGAYDTVGYLSCVERAGSITTTCQNSYNHIGSNPQDCELAPAYHDLVVAEAVREAQRALNMQGEFGLSTEKVSSLANS